MYKDYFGFVDEPFSIVPSPKFLFLSGRHREALTHLQMGISGGGGFAMLTGEVGTGKTTVSKAMLASLESNWVTGLILNPTFSELELLEAICDEFCLTYQQPTSLKQLSQLIYQYLLQNHQQGKQTLLFIDEAQHLSAQVLEQLRLLTNLETESHKLLKVLLIGQPELQQKLQTVELRQLAQRITGRYHLLPLIEKEIGDYIQFRLRVAGCDKKLFSSKALKIIASKTQGVPRLINLVCDKALHYAMLSQLNEVDSKIALQASQDVVAFQVLPQAGLSSSTSVISRKAMCAGFILCAGLGFGAMSMWQQYHRVGDEHAMLVQQQQKLEQRSQTLVMQREQQNQRLDSLVEQSSSLTTAMQSLYALWGYKASIIDANCLSSTHAPFHCYQGTASLEQIVASNRPTVLTLYREGMPFYALLTYVGRDKVELIINNQSLKLPLTWLKQHWQGEFTTLWYSEITDTLKLDYRGVQVSKLDELLAKALNVEPLNTSLFTASLKQRVSSFQEWQGLTADGVAGERTLRQLDRLSNHKAPTLLAVSKEAM
ncbi:ExeA family protein [Vibrio gallicus]|uniref:ExeA family protein n=1 Tax=Vibrio gallicus TaxID=190897 RepID=UPI0021C25975|nr:ExeA family protein [Vibrio gallicus]